MAPFAAQTVTNKAVPYISLEKPRVIVMLLTLLLVGNYMIWRLDTLNPEHPIFSLLLYGGELFGVVMMLMHSFMMWRLSVRESLVPEPGLSVDVFIPTINEPLSIVRRTALTAIAMDYPHETWLLDDGRRPEIHALAEELGCHYLSRPDNTHAKAGNLNHALARTRGELIAIFDADHAPKKSFLVRTLGYFRDSRVAFVQTPQDFYNLDSYQHRAHIRDGRLWSEQSLFFRVIQRGKDAWNAAFFCGSCAVIRRSALLEVGGFATGTVTEDIHTSIRLHKKGYKSVYHEESLAFGVAAAQVEPFLKQRIRWGQGAMQVWRSEGLLLTRKLTLAQKICYMASILTYFDGWQKTIYYATPALVLLTGIMPIVTTPEAFMIHFIPYLLMIMWGFSELSRGYGRVMIIEQYNMARFAAFAYATLGFFRRRLRFSVTNKKLTGRSAYAAYLWPQMAVFMLNMVALLVGTLFYWQGYVTYISPLAFVVNFGWASVNLALALAVLMFSLHRVGFRRQDYRFAIPFAASIQVKDGSAKLAAVEDISSSGLQLLLDEDPHLTLDDTVYGNLQIPGETIPFRAIVRALRPPVGEKRFPVGCQFVWETHAARQRLELFLYGSDLESQVHHISERMRTPIEQLVGPLGTWHELDERPAAAAIRGDRLSMVYAPQEAPDAYSEPGFIALDARGRNAMAMVFTRFSPGAMLRARVFTQNGWQPLQGRAAKENSVEYKGRTMYFYAIEGLSQETYAPSNDLSVRRSA